MINRSGNGIISYYLTTVSGYRFGALFGCEANNFQIMKEIGITSSSTQLGINGGMKSCSLVTNIGMSFLADKMGRRPMYLISVSDTTTAQPP